jgi:hypothetical protein
VAPFVAPYFNFPETLDEIVLVLNSIGMEASIYQFDRNRNMLQADYPKCVPLSVHQGLLCRAWRKSAGQLLMQQPESRPRACALFRRSFSCKVIFRSSRAALPSAGHNCGRIGRESMEAAAGKKSRPANSANAMLVGIRTIVMVMVSARN